MGGSRVLGRWFAGVEKKEVRLVGARGGGEGEDRLDS